MLSRTLNKVSQSPWGKLVWTGVGAIALLQVAAFYNVCVGQVARSHARETVALEQSNAFSDCLAYMDKSTISSCTRHAAGIAEDAGSLAARDLPRTAAPAARAVLGSAVPVSYVYH